jgi:predicted nucleic acid-binding protein
LVLRRDIRRRSGGGSVAGASVNAAGSVADGHAGALQEFFAVVTRKIKVRLTTEQALEFLDTWSECPVVLLDYPVIREAAKPTADRQLSFWDSLILIAAKRPGA